MSGAEERPQDDDELQGMLDFEIMAVIADLRRRLEGWAIESGQQTERAMRAESDLAAARARIAELSEALEFYADPDLYRWSNPEAQCLAEEDEGERARAALVPTTSEGGQQAAAGGESDE